MVNIFGLMEKTATPQFAQYVLRGPAGIFFSIFCDGAAEMRFHGSKYRARLWISAEIPAIQRVS